MPKQLKSPEKVIPKWRIRNSIPRNPASVDPPVIWVTREEQGAEISRRNDARPDQYSLDRLDIKPRSPRERISALRAVFTGTQRVRRSRDAGYSSTPSSRGAATCFSISVSSRQDCGAFRFSLLDLLHSRSFFLRPPPEPAPLPFLRTLTSSSCVCNRARALHRRRNINDKLDFETVRT